MLVEMVEFNGKHGASMLKELVPKVLPVFERVIKARKEFRTSNPAMFMRTFFGMIMSYYITQMVIGNSVVSKLMPQNAQEVFVDIYLDGILKKE
jgi:hypothetical protein